MKKDRKNRKGLHKDWRVWVAVVLMLAAIAVYVLTLDDSIEPTGQIQGTVVASTVP
jgi:hypothetical protein